MRGAIDASGSEPAPHAPAGRGHLADQPGAAARRPTHATCMEGGEGDLRDECAPGAAARHPTDATCMEGGQGEVPYECAKDSRRRLRSTAREELDAELLTLGIQQ